MYTFVLNINAMQDLRVLSADGMQRDENAKFEVQNNGLNAFS